MKPQTNFPDLKIDIKTLKQGASVLRAINHNLRQQMLALIHKMQTATVTEIRKKLKLEQSITSQHLAILRRADFVLTQRDGKFIYYSVNHNRIIQVEKLCKDLSDQKLTE